MQYRGDHQNFHQGTVQNRHPLGRAFRRTRRLQAVLPDYGFLDGGCLSLALAVQRVLGEAAEVVFVLAGAFPQHAVVRLVLDDEVLYLDADGLGSADDLLAKMRLVERVRGNLHLAPVPLAEATHHGITDGADYSLVLAPLLETFLVKFTA